MNVTKLKSDFYSIFDTMNSIYKNGEEYMATQCAKAIYDFIYSGNVTTVDAGTGSRGGVYSGSGSGKMKINRSMLSSLLLNTFLSTNNNSDLAILISSNINTVCSMINTVETSTSGTSVLSPQSQYYDTGKGKGVFIGSQLIIQTKLQSCFDVMNNMYTNGNLYFANEWANALNNYMSSGAITVTLQSPMIGGGTGRIS